GNTLEGSAKDWYHEWTTARGEYTFDELISALLARFATEVQARDVEDPLGEAVALDQELGATRPTPTATMQRSSRQRKARGGSSLGVHGSGGAGPSSDPA
ncbi:hypothetical protein VaNZ11_011295, partial [Volvox africanus]